MHVLETTGTQEYKLSPQALSARVAAAYGDDAAADVAAHFG